MKYTVIWTPVSEQRLAELWVASRMRHAIKEAAFRIDAMLERRPNDAGESRNAGRRMMFEWPLGVLFEVSDQARQVRVLSIWQI